jgi:hypothetical protein
VTVAGVKLRSTHVTQRVGGCLDEQANDVLALYVQDDRHGPYLSADLGGGSGITPVLRIKTFSNGDADIEKWTISHVLIPMHAKIRLSFQDLREIASDIVAVLAAHVRVNYERDSHRNKSILVDIRVVRSFKYVRELLKRGVAAEQVKRFCSNFHLPRYVGIIHVKSNLIGEIDILVDTTDTPRNLHCLAVVGISQAVPQTTSIVQFLADRYESNPCLAS